MLSFPHQKGVSSFLLSTKLSSVRTLVHLKNKNNSRPYTKKLFRDTSEAPHVIPPWFSLYRMIYKMHQTSIPPTQLDETKRMTREIFRDYIKKYLSDSTTFEQRAVLLEEAKERAISYIENLRQMTFNGSEALELHSASFWNRFYDKIKLEYLKQKDLNSDLKMSTFLESEKYLHRDWYGEFESLKHHLLPILQTLQKDSPILIIGTGLSTLPVEIYKLGYTNITCTDVSETLCSMMREFSTDVLGENSIKFSVLDIKDMTALSENSFDIVIDKAVMDTLYMEEDDTAYQQGELEKGIQNVRAVQDQVLRLLKPDRKWVVFSQYDYSLEPESEDDTDVLAFDVSKCQVEASRDDDESLYVYILTK